MTALTALENEEVLFIIGAPRSGTTMLQILLGSHPAVATTVELTIFNRYVGPWLQTWTREVENTRSKEFRQGLHYLWEEAEFVELLHGFVQATYARVLAKKPGATRVLDKQPGYSLHVPAMRRLLPRARFIHLIRDGRDVALSLVAAKRDCGFGKDTVAEAAAQWKKYVLGAREAAAFGSDYLEVRYEDFLQRPAESFGAVLDFCGLAHEPQWLTDTLAANTFDEMKAHGRTGDPAVSVDARHYRKGQAGAWREELTARAAYAFERAAGGLLRELGYEAAPGWWAGSAADRYLEPLRYAWRSRCAKAGQTLRAALGQAQPRAPHLGWSARA